MSQSDLEDLESLPLLEALARERSTLQRIGLSVLDGARAASLIPDGMDEAVHAGNSELRQFLFGRDFDPVVAVQRPGWSMLNFLRTRHRTSPSKPIEPPVQTQPQPPDMAMTSAPVETPTHQGLSEETALADLVWPPPTPEAFVGGGETAPHGPTLPQPSPQPSPEPSPMSETNTYQPPAIPVVGREFTPPTPEYRRFLSQIGSMAHSLMVQHGLLPEEAAKAAKVSVSTVEALMSAKATDSLDLQEVYLLLTSLGQGNLNSGAKLVFTFISPSKPG